MEHRFQLAEQIAFAGDSFLGMTSVVPEGTENSLWALAPAGAPSFPCFWERVGTNLSALAPQSLS